MFDPVGDVSSEGVHSVVGGSLEFLGGERGEPALDQVGLPRFDGHLAWA